jgi:hypothetical protein
MDKLRRIGSWAWKLLSSDPPPTPSTRLGWIALVFLLSFLVRSLYTVDLSPLMYTRAQPSTRISTRYDEGALFMLEGHGILYPDNAKPEDTGLLARPPGYSLFLKEVYAVAGRSFFVAQFVQNLLTSAASLLVLFLGYRLVGPRVGLVAGLLAAVSPHLAFLSNLILPDALCPLGLLAAACLLVEARPDTRHFLLISTLGGAAIGASAWLRPNMMLLAPLLAVSMTALHRLRGRGLIGAALVPLAAAIAISPITIRNYLIYHEFVPLSINGGLTLWEGIADAGGQKFGARRADKQVMEEEAVRYHNRRYAEWWASPDGIQRDRDRYRRSFEVIQRNPFWYGRAMLRRMGQMLNYASEPPPLVGQTALAMRPSPEEESDPIFENFGERGLAAPRPQLSDATWLAFGRVAAFTRPAVRLAQRLTRSAMLPLTLIGTLPILLSKPRRALFLWTVPLYCLVTESMMLLEWRVVVSMHVFVFIFAAAGWVILFAALGVGWERLRRRVKS